MTFENVVDTGSADCLIIVELEQFGRNAQASRNLTDSSRDHEQVSLQLVAFSHIQQFAVQL